VKRAKEFLSYLVVIILILIAGAVDFVARRLSNEAYSDEEDDSGYPQDEPMVQSKARNVKPLPPVSCIRTGRNALKDYT
jgi:hypothetical protein